MVEYFRKVKSKDVISVKISDRTNDSSTFFTAISWFVSNHLETSVSSFSVDGLRRYHVDENSVVVCHWKDAEYKIEFESKETELGGSSRQIQLKSNSLQNIKDFLNDVELNYMIWYVCLWCNLKAKC